jgi:hypothetical protein
VTLDVELRDTDGVTLDVELTERDGVTLDVELSDTDRVDDSDVLEVTLSVGVDDGVIEIVAVRDGVNDAVVVGSTVVQLLSTGCVRDIVAWAVPTPSIKRRCVPDRDSYVSQLSDAKNNSIAASGHSCCNATHTCDHHDDSIRIEARTCGGM